ncbi:MAG TPA: universal stress protein [Actinophytocola sp.]|uniref:universal stress protein n=1 Tax=Actinophytocola sp. TaxID=1872138 RepID=UPI002DB5F2AC|nr:universal stress protein [Actinophytocola sp.]HEU5470798.1 universal stress protein [Actinophytocola sp.]
MNNMPIVVGVDGSDASLAAVRWATAQALRHGLRLCLVYADNPPPSYGPVTADPLAMDQHRRDTVNELVRAAAAEVPSEVPCETEIVSGPAVPVLRAASERAVLLVCGSSGLGAISGLLAGSVTVALAGHGTCPLVVVRGEPEQPDAPVAVGVDGSPASDAAIGLAFEQAAQRGGDLIAVHAWTDTVFPVGAYRDAYLAVDWELLDQQAHELLTERLAGWADKYPQVTVRRVVARDRPAHALLDAAKGAGLIVVGSRGRGGFAGLLLGSVSQAMIHHAPCPVMIARPAAVREPT